VPDSCRLEGVMKKTGILNRELSLVIASMGHTDLLVVADAGLPIPIDVPCIDLSVVPGMPPILDVVRAIAGDLQVERVVLAEEAREHGRPGLADAMVGEFPGAAMDWLPHAEFKRLTTSARAVVRTGECSPYANIILQSGVTF
jgi:D-ribose pyranase